MSGAGHPRGEDRAGTLTQEQASVFEAFVVPGYLTLFGEPLLEQLVPARDARVLHLDCRTGYPDRALLVRLPNAHVFGVDASEHAIALARAKAGTFARENGDDVVFDYRVASSYPLAFPDGAFSHTIALHPTPGERGALLRELARLTAPRGQSLLALPMRGSFAPVFDLLRECALKFDLTVLDAAVDAIERARPTDDMLVHELDAAGFRKVTVEVHQRSLRYPSGRAYFEDPIVRLFLRPALASLLPAELGVDPVGYLRDAIDKYWSDGSFELPVQVGVASCRRNS